MRLTVTITGPAVGEPADVLIDADGTTTMRELAWHLAALLFGESERSLPALYVHGRRLSPDLTLYESPVCDGAVVGLASPGGTMLPEPHGLAEIRIVGGPGAGAVHRLSPGEYTAGTARTCRIRLDTGPSHALTVLVAADGTCRVRPVKGVRVEVDREEIEAGGEADWEVGAQVSVDATLLERATPSLPDAAVLPSIDGVGLDYNRPPRLQPEEEPETFRYPRRPSKPEKRSFPLLLIIVTPLVMAGGSYLLFQNPRFLLFALMSPLILIVSQLSNRSQGKKSYQQQLREYKADVEQIKRDIEAAVVVERKTRRAAVPDPAAALLIAAGPRQRLWERRWSDPDFLDLRIGAAHLRSAIRVQDSSQKEPEQTAFFTHDVPMSMPFRELGVVGLAGGDPDAVARWLVAQAAILHSPSDLRVCILTGISGEEQWSWAHWLPHTNPLHDTAIASIGTDSASIGARVAALNALLAARLEAGGDRRKKIAADGDPDVLVVLDGARRLRSLPGVIQLLRQGPAAGIYVLCIDTERRFLPEECRGVAVVGDDGRLRVDLGPSGTFSDVVPDAPVADWCTSVARALAPIRDVGDEAEEGALPQSARLLDVLDLEPPTVQAITANWALGGRSTRAVLGVGMDGAFALDIVRDGPHALIAGTTGAGKSELLQSLVASLAVVNRPDELTFVLVDYKGGSAFKDCVDLPHTVGMVTDLDAHLVERALVSLGAELKRREHILAGVGAKDIEDYQEKPGVPPLPRLLLVIDEFASMVRELPDFVKGLVNIAQRGRSLGIHLILATQRPAGAVTPDIRANTNLRIALRMTDVSESRDVIDAPESAQISRSTPGRAYVRLGQAALLPFQAGRVGGRRPGEEQVDEPSEPFLAELTWDDLGGPAPMPPAPITAKAERTELTDLAVLVETIRKATADAGIARQPSPWLAPLPAALTLAELPPVEASGRALPPVGYGIVDVPAEQGQQPLLFDLEQIGHLLIIAAPRSGRSQTLRTLAGALAATHSSADVHLYGIDCGNGALLPLVELPHCGAVANRSETERVSRLLDRMMKEIGRRQALLAANSVADLAELRAAGTPVPHIVLMIDRWEAFEQAFTAHDGGSAMDKIRAILREGAGVGVHVVAAGDRTLTASRYASTTEDKLVFRLNDKADYAMTGLSRKAVPEEMPNGRALRAADAAEVQIALLDPDPSGVAQASALRRVAEMAAARDAAVPATMRPFGVDVLPDRVTFDEAWAQRAGDPAPLWAMVGVGGDDLSACGAELGSIPSFIIAGPPRAGRSTALATAALSLLAGGTQIVVVTPKNSPLRALRGRPGVVDVLEGHIALDDYRAAVQRVDSSTGVIVVDDAEMLIHSELDNDFSAIARGLAGDGWGIVVAGTTDILGGGMSGWHVSMRRNRHGMLIAPQSIAERDVIGVRLSSGMVGGNPVPGRAYVHLGDGVVRTVQIPETVL